MLQVNCGKHEENALHVCLPLDDFHGYCWGLQFEHIQCHWWHALWLHVPKTTVKNWYFVQTFSPNGTHLFVVLIGMSADEQRELINTHVRLFIPKNILKNPTKRVVSNTERFCKGILPCCYL